MATNDDSDITALDLDRNISTNNDITCDIPSDVFGGERSRSVKSSDSDDANESWSDNSNDSSTNESTIRVQNVESDALVLVPRKLSKSKRRMKDRSKLRKGKWTVEEEEYTSRIIHCFSTGLLTLPEGSTLRSYIADKLNCDPMRVTKKYAGAACLGRRVCHFRDQVHPTIAEIQLAKLELDHLEQRFRLRVVGGPSSSTVSVPSIEQAQPTPTSTHPTLQPPSQQNPQDLLQTLLLGISAFQQNASLTLPPAAHQAQLTPVCLSSLAQPTAPASGSSIPSLQPAPGLPGPAIPAVLAQLLLASAASASSPFGSVQNATPFAGAPQSPAVDPNAANWAFNQVAAALGPVLAQLAAANIQQQQQAQLQAQQQQQAQLQAQQQQQHQAQLQAQQQLQQQAQLQAQQQAEQLIAHQKSELQNRIQEQQNIIHQKLVQLQNQGHGLPQSQPSHPSQPALSIQEEQSRFFAAEFKKSYDRHLKSLGIEPEPAVGDVNVIMPSTQASAPTASPTVISSKRSSLSELPMAETSESIALPRTEEDKEGGTALLGFLSSLRKSYENVLRGEGTSESSKCESWHNATANGAPTVTDSNSSQQRDSSVEDSDWNSDKKSDNSSSEDSEKEGSSKKKIKSTGIYHNQGPPRKRMKVRRVADAVRKGPST